MGMTRSFQTVVGNEDGAFKSARNGHENTDGFRDCYWLVGSCRTFVFPFYMLTQQLIHRPS
jgi:hypothetical protein